MKKIMIVEDDKDICRELKEMLDHAGYEGVVLSDFHNGCRQILKAKPDLVLLDINIPFQNAFERTAGVFGCAGDHGDQQGVGGR